METQVEMFDEYEGNTIERMNNFMIGKEIIGIKTNTVVAITGQFFTKYLVIYRTEKDAFSGQKEQTIEALISENEQLKEKIKNQQTEIHKLLGDKQMGWK